MPRLVDADITPKKKNVRRRTLVMIASSFMIANVANVIAIVMASTEAATYCYAVATICWLVNALAFGRLVKAMDKGEV